MKTAAKHHATNQSAGRASSFASDRISKAGARNSNRSKGARRKQSARPNTAPTLRHARRIVAALETATRIVNDALKYASVPSNKKLFSAPVRIGIRPCIGAKSTYGIL